MEEHQEEGEEEITEEEHGLSDNDIQALIGLSESSRNSQNRAEAEEELRIKTWTQSEAEKFPQSKGSDVLRGRTSHMTYTTYDPNINHRIAAEELTEEGITDDEYGISDSAISSLMGYAVGSGQNIFPDEDEVIDETFAHPEKEELDLKMIAVILLFLALIIMLIVFSKKCKRPLSSPMRGKCIKISCQMEPTKSLHHCSGNRATKEGIAEFCSNQKGCFEETKEGINGVLVNQGECFAEAKEKLQSLAQNMITTSKDILNKIK